MPLKEPTASTATMDLLQILPVSLYSSLHLKMPDIFRNEKEDIATVTTEIQRIIRDYYEQLYTNKLKNLEEMETFLETHNLPGVE